MASRRPTSDEPEEHGNPLALEADTFEPAENAIPADDSVADDYDPPPRELLEWTPERAGSVVRAGGFMLHAADGLSREPEGHELWRATETDVAAMAPPLARILNRYAPARRLAGVADEGELAFAMIDYARRNLADRGRVAGAKRHRLEQAEAAAGETWPHPADSPPAE